MLLDSNKSYRENYDNFVWRIPEFYNIAHDVCDRHADGDNGVALIHDPGVGEARTYTFRDIQRLANRLANLFVANGEEFVLDKFVFRAVAGLYFATLYVFRGLGIAVGAHVLYDLIVGVPWG